MADLARAEARLHETFGFKAFRSGQSEIIGAVLDGRDVLAVMPTGAASRCAINCRHCCATG